MSRSGYSDDYDDSVLLNLYRQAVHSAFHGSRGQHFLRKLRDALDALPVKRLITDEIRDEAGDVCALGAVDPTVDGYDADDLAKRFGIARAMAAEIVYINDEWLTDACHKSETPEERWTRMRAWVEEQIVADPAKER